MKLETAVILLKLLFYMMLGATAPLVSGLAQWANTGEWPPRIVWVVIIGSCLSGLATQGLAFLSGSYSAYMRNRNGTVDNPPKPANTTTP